MEKNEQDRLALQLYLDGEKTQAERNRLGQFATPTALATQILNYARNILPKQADVRFLDPAIGTGSFYSAFLRVFGTERALVSVGYEIDDHYGDPARKLWEGHALDIHSEDFTKATPPKNENEKASLVICNPPYVRHHHMDGEEKKRLNVLISMRHGISLSGLSGLYCYFLCMSKDWMMKDGLAAWLIPSEFMDVNYGAAIKEFLLNKVTLLHIHRFSPDDVQFTDALVSSAVVWFRNETPSNGQHVKFSYGGTLLKPNRERDYPIEILREEGKWTRLANVSTPNGYSKRTPNHVIGDFFDTKRGIATGANDFFILSPAEVQRRDIPPEFLIPILPSPRYLKSDVIESNADGTPKIDNCGFLFTSKVSENRIHEEYPKVWHYLEDGRKQGIPARYICRNRQPWYQQEHRKVASFLCTYMGRANGKSESRPFRFILNYSNAIVANVYLMLYPKPWVQKALEDSPKLAEEVWCEFQAIPVGVLVGEGRVYGGGLHKLEPRELLNAPADKLAYILSGIATSPATQLTLL